MGSVLLPKRSASSDDGWINHKGHTAVPLAAPVAGVKTSPTSPLPATRIILADAAMVFCQLLLFINHYRRLLDASRCATDGLRLDVPTPGRLAAYPCGASVSARIAFLVQCAATVFHASFQLPRGELWVPVVSSAILAQLLAMIVMPRGAYLAFGRRACMVLVGLLPKAVSLATFLAFPHLRPSTYFCTYLPLEGAITVWQQVVYNYPFWPGMAVLAAHCALSSAICFTVGPRLHAAGLPPLFNAPWVLAQTYSCAVLAAGVALQQHPAALQALRKAVRRLRSGGIVASPPRAGGKQDAWDAGPGSGCASGDAVEELQALQVVRKIIAGGRSSFESSTASVSAADSMYCTSSSGSSEPASGTHSGAWSGSHSSAASLAMASATAAAAAEEDAATQQLKGFAGASAQMVDASARGKSVAHRERSGAARAGGIVTASSGSPSPAPSPAPSGRPAYLPFQSRVAAMPPSGAFSLKQPTGLSKWTIVEDQEFKAPPAVGVSGSLAAIGLLAARSGRFRRYQSRAAPQRVYMKIPWAEPDQLPTNFLERLNVALSEGLDCMAVGVSARAGCIELVFDLVPQGAFGRATDNQAASSSRQHPLLPLMPVGAATVQRQARHGHLDLLGEVGIQVGYAPEDSGAEEAGLGGGGLLDSHGALEEAVLSGLLNDAEPASWIDALHLQPPPGAEVLTQACGRVWISRWDHTLRQWVPEKAGGIRPSQLPRITQLKLPCILLQPEGEGGGVASVRLTVSNAHSAPAFSARCRGRYLPVSVRQVRSRRSDGAGLISDDGAGSGAFTSPPTSGPLEGKISGLEVDDSASRLGLGRIAGPATVVLELPSGLPRNGLVVVECKVGKLLSNWRPVIVTDDPLLAAELATLQTAPSDAPTAGLGSPPSSSDASCCSDDVAGWDDLLTDLGLWLDYLEVLGRSTGGSRRSAAGGADSTVGCGPLPSRQASSLDFGQGLASLYATERYRAHMVGIAISLLEYAVDRGWTHTAGMIVEQLLAAGVPWGEVLERCSDGLTLLHRAVRSTHGEMVQLVVQLGEQHGTPFDWQALSFGPPEDVDGADGLGVTPLHLAAALPDGGRLAERILSEYQAACELWASALDSHGVRPVDCARASGHGHLADEPWGPTSQQQREQQQPQQERRLEGPRAAAATSFPDPGEPARAAVELEDSIVTSNTDSSGLLGSGDGGDGTAAERNPSSAGRVGERVKAALRAVFALLAAPFVNDRQSELQYMRSVGARYNFWSAAYLVYQMCIVAAVCGRMIKEARAADMVGMLIFLSPHTASAALLCVNYEAWLRLREPLCAAVTITRTAAKLLPALGILPYPSSSTTYMSSGMDVLLEGLIPAFFERMRTPLVLLLRAVEGLATGLLYQKLHATTQHALPEVSCLMCYALAWTLGSAAISAALDARDRSRGSGGGLRLAGASYRGAESSTPVGWDSSAGGLVDKKVA